MVYADALSNMYHATAVREVHKGQAMEVANKYLSILEDGTLPLQKDIVLETLAQAVADFNEIETVDGDYPKVGIVGEIYVKYNSFGNNRVVEWLMDQGIEVIVPSFAEFFVAWFPSIKAKVQAHIKKPDLLWLLAPVLNKYTQALQNRVEAVMEGFRYYRPAHTIQDVAQKAQEIVSLAHQYGESWLIAGEIGEFIKHGIPNVLCLQPFGCIANQVIAKGVTKRMREKFPQLNLLYLDCDAGTSEVNFVNRLYFFINPAKASLAT